MPKEIEFILKDFVRHVVNLKAEDDPAGTGFHREFRILREEQIQIKNEERFPTEDGRREESLKKNRYKDILPRDDKRVKLKEIEGEKGSDYINASFIEDVNGEKGYIAAQGPMPHTVSDFWRMMWQYNTEIVFMVCRLKEDGRPKCEKYWADCGDSTVYGDITVHTESEVEIQDDFYRRQLRAEKDGETHTLTQFHYVGWPDHNTPSSPDVLRTMIEDVRNFRKRLDLPMVVHCSAGCGRTGTICAIDYAWTLLDRGMIKEEFSMFEIIKSMREQRMSMVQTPDQYEYTHMVMKSLCNEWLASFSSHDYENVIIGRPPPEEEEEEVEETYANIEFDQGDGQDGDLTEMAVEKVVKMPEPPKQVEKLVASSQPTTNAVSQVKAHEPTEEKAKPEDSNHKPQAGDTVPKATSARTATMFIANQSNNDAGEYVEVLKTATVPQKASSTSSDAQRNSSNGQRSSSDGQRSSSDAQKKSSAPSSGTVDTQKQTPSVSSGAGVVDPHKTLIVLGGGNATPKIIKSGSVGVAHSKQQAPRPPVQEVMKPIVVDMKQQQQQQQKQQQERQQTTPKDDVKSVEVVKIRKAAERQASTTDYENVQVSSVTSSSPSESSSRQNSVRKSSESMMSDEEAPDLPSRNYKPEEISSLPNSPTTTMAPSSPSPSTSSSTDKNHEPVIVTTVTSTTKAPPATSPPQPPTSPTPAAMMNHDRPPQPLPTHHHLPPPAAQGVQMVRAGGHGMSAGQAVSAKSGGQVVHGARPGGQIVNARPVGHQSQAVPGMVSVMVGAQPQQQHGVPVTRHGPARPADSRSAGHLTQPVIVHSHGKGPAPRHGPVMVTRPPHPHTAGPKGHGHHGAPAHAAATQMVVRTGPGKVVYLTDRPARVKGPKDMPPEWNARGKNYGGTRL